MAWAIEVTLRHAKQFAAILVIFLATRTSALSAYTMETTGTMGGEVADSEGAAIEGATVLVRNLDTQFSRTVLTGRHGQFSMENLPIGTYAVEAWSRAFERASNPGIVIADGTTKQASFKLSVCGMRHLDLYKENFATRTKIRAYTDFEKGSANKAQGLPCRAYSNSPSLFVKDPPRCANQVTMKFFSDLVEKNRAGHLPESGEGPVHAGAYFGAIVEFDKATKQWVVKLRLEYSVACGMLCGVGTVYDRWVYFDQGGTVTSVDDDCGCTFETIS